MSTEYRFHCTSTKFCLSPLHVYKHEKEKKEKGEKILLYLHVICCGLNLSLL